MSFPLSDCIGLMPTDFFLRQCLPYFDNPKDLLVLRCVNKAHQQTMLIRAPEIQQQFEPFYEALNTAISSASLLEAEKQVKECKQDLSVHDLRELKSLCFPPIIVKAVGQCACILLTNQLKWEWNEVQSLMEDPGEFYAQFEKCDMNTVPKLALQACEKIIRWNGLTENNVTCASKACTGLFKWINAVVMIHYGPLVQQGIKDKVLHEQFNKALDLIGQRPNRRKAMCLLGPVSRASQMSTPKVGTPGRKNSTNQPKLKQALAPILPRPRVNLPKKQATEDDAEKANETHESAKSNHENLLVHTTTAVTDYIQRGGSSKELERRTNIVKAIVAKIKETEDEVERYRQTELAEIDLLEERLLSQVHEDMDKHREKIKKVTDDAHNEIQNLTDDLQKARYEVNLPANDAGRLLSETIHVEQITSSRFLDTKATASFPVDTTVQYNPPLLELDCCRIVTNKPRMQLACGHVCLVTNLKRNKYRCLKCEQLITQEEYVKLYS